MKKIKITKSYFTYFSNKDIYKLEKLFDKNISLKDWDINVEGKQEVIKTLKNIFTSVDTIKIIPKNILNDKIVVVCEIDILINNTDTIHVVDIIKFNKELKIIEISAYKQ